MLSRSSGARIGAALLLAAVLAGCGTATTGTSSRSGTATVAATSTAESNPPGDIPDTQAFVDYAAASGLFTVRVPEGWARTDNGAQTTFSDKYNSITITQTPSSATPTVQSGQAELKALGDVASGFTAGGVSSVQRNAGTAVLITYRAESPTNSVTGKTVPQDVQRYEFWKSGQLVTLTLAAPVGSDNVDPWQLVTDSFTWTR